MFWRVFGRTARMPKVASPPSSRSIETKLPPTQSSLTSVRSFLTAKTRALRQRVCLKTVSKRNSSVRGKRKMDFEAFSQTPQAAPRLELRDGQDGVELVGAAN